MSQSARDNVEFQIRTAAGRVAEGDLALFISRCFLASPVFAGPDSCRYEPAPILKKLRGGQSFVALTSGVLVGSITLFPPDPESSCESFRTLPQIGLLATEPAYSGQGIAGRLIGHAERECRAPAIALSVTCRSPRLIETYLRRGYVKVEEFHWPNALDDSWILRKELSDVDGDARG